MLNVYYCKIKQERRTEEPRDEINEMPKTSGSLPERNGNANGKSRVPPQSGKSPLPEGPSISIFLCAPKLEPNICE